jgi:hypothetical protein
MSENQIELISLVIAWIGMGFLSVLAIIVLLRIGSGKLIVRGMVCDLNTGEVSPGRIQTLVLTIGYAGYLLLNLKAGAPHFPPITTMGLALLFGSHAGYLGLKGYSHQQHAKQASR